MQVIQGNMRTDLSGRKRKPLPNKRKAQPKFVEGTGTRYNARSSEINKYPSAKMAPPSKNEGRKKEGGKYTGTYVIGIGTMHKSNAVPITSKQAAREISEMIK